MVQSLALRTLKEKKKMAANCRPAASPERQAAGEKETTYKYVSKLMDSVD